MTLNLLLAVNPRIYPGVAIHDTAVLSGGDAPTGTMTFHLYGPNDDTCTGDPIFASVVTVSGNGTYTSDPFTPTVPGVYRWIARYSGDANNPAIQGACND